jgi:hypothetical protein
MSSAARLWKTFRASRTAFRVGRKLFAFGPDFCSPSARNPVRLHFGIAFALPRIPQTILHLWPPVDSEYGNRTHKGLIMAQWDFVMVPRREDEWVWGWDSTPGIVSVWADLDGRATVWRRIPDTGELPREEIRFRPWLVLDRLDDLRHLGDRLGPDCCEGSPIWYRELDGPGSLCYLVSSDDGRALVSAVLDGATRRLGWRVSHLRDLEKESVLALVPEEQYLLATGRTYFRELSFDNLHRMQFDFGDHRLESRPGSNFHDRRAVTPRVKRTRWRPAATAMPVRQR